MPNHGSAHYLKACINRAMAEVMLHCRMHRHPRGLAARVRFSSGARSSAGQLTHWKDKIREATAPTTSELGLDEVDVYQHMFIHGISL